MGFDKDFEDRMEDIENRIGDMDKFDAMISDLENTTNLSGLSENLEFDKEFDESLTRLEVKRVDKDSLGEPVSDEDFYRLLNEDNDDILTLVKAKHVGKNSFDETVPNYMLDSVMEKDNDKFQAKEPSNIKCKSKGTSSKKKKSEIINIPRTSEGVNEEHVVMFAGKRARKVNSLSTLKEYRGKRKEPKPIVDLNAGEAFDFLMGSEQYCRTELPIYFDFSAVLEYAKEAVGSKTLKECTIEGMSPADLDKVNLDMMTNKDGWYGVRPLTLANPFLYYMMVRDICSDEAWKSIKECFSLFSDEHISACAIPMVKMDNRPEPFRGSTAVLNWWNSMEQTSIELSLKYRYMFVSDITNCFGQINPESIGWSLARKGTEHETSDNDHLAKEIQGYLGAMQHGRNIGIPQGSTLFSLIAEIILGYSDMIFAKEVREAQATKGLPVDLDYHVLRYVDDYRIFCSDRDALDKLSYILQGVLERFNFRMNTSKTKITNSIISDSIKPDKLFYIYNTPIESKQVYQGEGDQLLRGQAYDFDGFQKHLLFIYEFSRRFPNSGQLKNLLSAFSRRLKDFLDGEGALKKKMSLKKDGVKKQTKTKKNHLWENRPVMIAIAAQIAEENVSSAHYALKVASQILADMPEKESERRREIIRLMYNKLRFQPNSAFTQVWLQNITHTSDAWSVETPPYDMPLCRIVAGLSETLWNNSWVKKRIVADFPVESIVDRKLLEEAGQLISFNERISYDEVLRYGYASEDYA